MFEDKAVLKELVRLASQLEIYATHLVFKGKRYETAPQAAAPLLTSLLYSECYALKERYQIGMAAMPQHFAEDTTHFINLLSQNNHSKDRIDPGWSIKNNYSNGHVEVTRHTESHIVPYSALRDLPSGTSASIGQTVSVFFPKEDRNRQPTFYYIFSNTGMDISQNLTRIYWNCTSEGAPVLIDAITKKLNYYGIPFLFKCLNHPTLYFRRDAAVLYVEDILMPLLQLLLPDICETMAPYLEEDVPLFSYAYRKGVGIAESPNTQESFGMNRIAIVAEVLLQAFPKNLTPEETVQEIAAAFLQKGISPKATFLNKGSRITFN